MTKERRWYNKCKQWWFGTANQGHEYETNMGNLVKGASCKSAAVHVLVMHMWSVRMTADDWRVGKKWISAPFSFIQDPLDKKFSNSERCNLQKQHASVSHDNSLVCFVFLFRFLQTVMHRKDAKCSYNPAVLHFSANLMDFVNGLLTLAYFIDQFIQTCSTSLLFGFFSEQRCETKSSLLL